MVKHPTFYFSSGHDLMVHEFKPCVGLCTESREPAWDSVSSFCPPPPLVLSLSLSLSHSLSKINFKKRKGGRKEKKETKEKGKERKEKRKKTE